jgi:predicted Fe-Mo cluster-binding NifX family protein
MATGDGILMKIAITTSVGNLDAPFDPRFGRGGYFVIVDNETEEWEAHPNPALNASGGAGVQAAQFIAGQGAQVAISGDFGPNAYNTLAAAGVQMFLTPASEVLTARELLARYRAGQLKQVTIPTTPGHHTARGQGRRGR